MRYDKKLKTISGPDLMKIVEEEMAGYHDYMRKAIEARTAGMPIDQTQKDYIRDILVNENEATYKNRLGAIKDRVSRIP